MDIPLLESVQLRLLYAGVYLTLGLISPSQLEMLDLEAWKLRKDKTTMKNCPGVKAQNLFPAIETVATEFAENLHGISNSVAVEKWRWLTRDSCDKLLLRFIRRFKNLKQAAAHLGNAIFVQVEKCNADRELKRGERYYIDVEKDPAYIEQFVSKKAMICGVDKKRRPVAIIKVGEHFPRKQSRAAVLRLLTVMLEHIYICQNEQMDGSIIIFDLHGFTMDNFDLDFTKVMIDWGTKIYPGILSRVFVHRAPKIFEGVWHLIKKLIDNDIRSMIKFTYKTKDLEDDIDPDMIPGFLGGKSSYTGDWIDLCREDDVLLKDYKGRHQLVSKRNKLHEEIEHLTRNWIMAHDNVVLRQNCLAQTQLNFWMLDPYVRARTIWDRQGTLSLSRPELAPGGISHVETAVARASKQPKTHQKQVSSLHSSPNSVPGLTYSSPSINSLSMDSVAPLFFNDTFMKPAVAPRLVRHANSEQQWSF